MAQSNSRSSSSKTIITSSNIQELTHKFIAHRSELTKELAAVDAALQVLGIKIEGAS